MRRLADELAFIGSPYSDDDLVMAILNGLGPEYDSFVIFVNTASRHSPFTFADLHGHLLSYESRIQGQCQVSFTTGSLHSPNNPIAFISGTKPSYQTRTNTNYQTRPNNNYQTHPNPTYQPRPANPPGFNPNPLPQPKSAQTLLPSIYSKPVSVQPKPPS